MMGAGLGLYSSLMKLRIILSLTAAIFALAIGIHRTTANKLFAEETTGEKIQNKAGDVNVGAKKTVRKAKKKIRDATGNHSLKEDIKDQARNAGDSIENTAKKIKRKVD